MSEEKKLDLSGQFIKARSAVFEIGNSDVSVRKHSSTKVNIKLSDVTEFFPVKIKDEYKQKTVVGVFTGVSGFSAIRSTFGERMGRIETTDEKTKFFKDGAIIDVSYKKFAKQTGLDQAIDFNAEIK